MSFAIGIDTARLSRFRVLAAKAKAYNLRKIFSSEELDYSLSRRQVELHLGVRFCAKEATLKALAGLGVDGIEFDMIEMIYAVGARPKISVSGISENIIISASVSNSDDYAFAIVSAQCREKCHENSSETKRELVQAVQRREGTIITKQEFYNNLEDILELAPGSIHGEEELASFEDWNSLAVLSFIAFADGTLAQSLEPEALKKAKKVSDLVALVAGGIES